MSAPRAGDSSAVGAPSVADRRSLRARLRHGDFLLGTFVASRDPAGCELLGRLGFDLLCVDGEHSAMGLETIERLVGAAELAPIPAIVRVPANDEVAIATTLDTGAAGILVPRVESAEQALCALAASRYPPAGKRGLGPSRATRYGAQIGAYRASANDELLLAIQVETGAAVERLDELLAIDGVDLYFVGPGDLGCSLGIDDPSDPDLRATVASVIERTRAAGRNSGVFAADAADAVRWREHGAQLVLLGSDSSLLARGVAAMLKEVRVRLETTPRVDS